MIYENLVRTAFKCGRLGIWFADASYYRGANTKEKEESLKNYILISLKIILTYQQNEFMAKSIEVFKKVYEELDKGEKSIEDAISQLQDCPL